MSKVLRELCEEFQNKLECYEKDHPKAIWVVMAADSPHSITIINGRTSDLIALLSSSIYAIAEEKGGDTVDDCIDLTSKIRDTTIAAAKVKQAEKEGGKGAMLKALLKELMDELED